MKGYKNGGKSYPGMPFFPTHFSTYGRLRREPAKPAVLLKALLHIIDRDPGIQIVVQHNLKGLDRRKIV